MFLPRISFTLLSKRMKELTANMIVFDGEREREKEIERETEGDKKEREERGKREGTLVL